MKKDTIEIPNAANHHVHLREGGMLAFTSFFSRLFSVVVAKANLKKPVVDPETYDRYYNRKLRAHNTAQVIGGLMMTPNTKAGMVEDTYRCGARFVANIPAGVSTNSNGVLLADLDDGKERRELYDCMSQLGMPLLLHVQSKFNKNLSDLELKIFFNSIKCIKHLFPRLKISIEHPNSRALIDFIIDTPGVTGGIAPHYGLYTRSDVVGKDGEILRPEIFCQPPYGDINDLLSIVRAIANTYVRGKRKFRYASDDAPPPISAKKGASPSSGVFSGPVGPCMAARMLEVAGRLDILPKFMEYDEEFFGVLLDGSKAKTMVLEKKPWMPPVIAQCEDFSSQQVYLLKGGESVSWQII